MVTATNTLYGSRPIKRKRRTSSEMQAIKDAGILGFTKGREALKTAATSKARKMAGGEMTQHEADAVCIALSAGLADEFLQAMKP